MDIALSRGTETPLYRQLQSALSRRIKSGDLKHGSRLLSVRAMAKDLGVSLDHRGTGVRRACRRRAGPRLSRHAGRSSEAPPRPRPRITIARDGGWAAELGETEWQTALPTYLSAPRTASMQSLLRPARRSGIISLTERLTRSQPVPRSCAGASLAQSDGRGRSEEPPIRHAAGRPAPKSVDRDALQRGWHPLSCRTTS